MVSTCKGVGFFPGSFKGNPDLIPEESTGFDIGIEQGFFDGVSKRQGVELSATVDFFNGLTATATYTYTDATEQTVAGGPRLEELRRPKHAGSLSAAYAFDEDRARVFGEVVFNGKILDTDFAVFQRVTLDSYTVVNVGGSYKLNDNLEAYGRIENLFDEQYQEVLGYNTEGRTAFVGLRGSY